MRAQPQATVLISGYYGFGNAGDEAVLAGILLQLSSLWPEARYLVLSGDPESTYREHGVLAVDRSDLRAVSAALRESTLLISGGGTLLQDVTSSRSLYYYLFLIMAAHWHGLPVAIYGQGLGPLRSMWNRFLTLRVLRLAQLVILRDPAAYEQLLAWGFDEERLCLGADPVVALEALDNAGIIDELYSQIEESKAALYVSLRPWPSLTAHLPAVAAALDSLSQKAWQVVFIPFQFEADYPVCQACAELMREPALVWETPLTFQEILTLFGEADYCLGMRLHSLVFAAIQQVPMVGLAYDPKVAQFMGQLGLENLVITLSGAPGECLDAQRLVTYLLWLEEKQEELMVQIKEKVGQMIARLRAATQHMGEQVGKSGTQSRM